MNSNRKFDRPIVQANEDFRWVVGMEDPAERYMVASDTAWALLYKVRHHPDKELLNRVLELAKTAGIDELAQLWAEAHAQTLPGVFWRLYLLREVITKNPETVRELYRSGLTRIDTIDGLVAGAEEPVTPETLLRFSDEVLKGIFAGDFGAAVDRAASACMILAAGAAHLADSRDLDSDEDALKLTKQALRFDQFARDLKMSAKLWYRGTFE